MLRAPRVGETLVMQSQQGEAACCESAFATAPSLTQAFAGRQPSGRVRG